MAWINPSYSIWEAFNLALEERNWGASLAILEMGKASSLQNVFTENFSTRGCLSLLGHLPPALIFICCRRSRGQNTS